MTEEWVCSSVSNVPAVVNVTSRDRRVVVFFSVTEVTKTLEPRRIVQVGSPKGITLKEEQSGVPRAPAEEEKRNAEDKVTQR